MGKKTVVYLFLKRLIDLIGAICGLIITTPILIATAIAIKIESEGPIVFSQERIGQYGKKFNMYKFRSMVINAVELRDKLMEKNEMNGPMFKIKDDPRITKVGSFIRKTSIDELPQLINILKGEMSLVGPRPSLPEEVNQFQLWMIERLQAKPGLTCYWQILGRNNINFKDWMNLDIKYVRDRNTWIDIKLIFKTIRVLFGDDNAR
ncbi:MAG: sugar transferase [Clostridiaceae bacterium]